MKNVENVLKLLFLSAIMAAFVIFAGCNNDDETPDNPAANNLIGFWTISNVQVDATIDGLTLLEFAVNVLGISEAQASLLIPSFEEGLTSNFTGTIEFKANGTYVTNIGGEPDDGEWSLNAAGDVITLDAGTIFEQDIDVVSLTSNMLVVGMEITELVDIDEDEMTPDVPVDMSIELTLSK